MSTKSLKCHAGGGRYTAPVCDGLELTSEGVLCQSMQENHANGQDGEFGGNY